MRVNALDRVKEVSQENPAVGELLRTKLVVEMRKQAWIASWRFEEAQRQAWEEYAVASLQEPAEVDPAVQRLSDACAVLWRSTRSEGCHFGLVIEWLYSAQYGGMKQSIRAARAAAQFLGIGPARTVTREPVRRAIMDTDCAAHLAELVPLCLALYDGKLTEDEFWQQANPLITLARQAAREYVAPIEPSTEEEQRLTGYTDGEGVLHVQTLVPWADGKAPVRRGESHGDMREYYDEGMTVRSRSH